MKKIVWMLPLFYFCLFSFYLATNLSVHLTTTPVRAAENKSSYLIPDSHRQRIALKSLYRFPKDRLRFARNEIFARHGLIFKNPEYKEFFTNKEWYKPSIKEAGNIQLNPVEIYNVKYLKFLEQEPPDTDKVWGMWLNRDHTHGGKEIEPGQKIEIDLDKDGNLESVSYSIREDEFDQFVITIQVNDQKIEKPVYAPSSAIAVVDIDREDPYLEIVFSDHGPSSDFVSYYYYYDGGNLIKMGETDGTIERGIEIAGGGHFKAMLPTQFLHTMPLEIQYELDVEHKLRQIKDDIYDVDYQLFLLNPLQVYRTRDEKSVSRVLSNGQNVQLTATDNEAWCQLETENGDKYWFRVGKISHKVFSHGREYSPNHVFDGLVYAD